MNSILITGNMGYIGPCAARHFRHLRPYTRLTGFDSGYFAASLLDRSELPERLLDAQLFGDVRQPPASLFDGVEAVIHLAAISNDPMGKAYEAVTADINHQATMNIAHQAKQAGVRRFVFASSCSVYGFAEDGARTELSSVNPLTAYARSKVACESDLQALADSTFVVTCLRFATACGASPRLRLDLVLNDFVASAIATGNIQILSDGTPWRPLIAVSDMCRAMEWAFIRDPSKEFQTINAGSNAWNYQVADLAQAVAKAVPGTSVSINENAVPDKRSYQVDFSLFSSLAPDHQPLATLDSTIAELKTLLEHAAFRDSNFRSSEFIRLNKLSDLRDRHILDSDLYWRHTRA